MRYTKLVLIPTLTIGAATASAQITENIQGMNSGVQQAYALSNLTVQGTARSMGFGNALGSIGGDFSSLSVNPAGLGVYRSSELTFTPTLRMNSASSQYLDEVKEDNNTRFNFNNVGIVFTNAPKGKRYEKRKWKAVSFAIGNNRVADFNRNYSFAGNNSANSASQTFEADANKFYEDPYSTNPISVPGYIGYQGYVINNYNNQKYEFASSVPFSGGVRQEVTVKERGRINEFALSLGGNYKEQLMLGATLGLPTVRYTADYTITESLAPGNVAANPDTFVSFKYNQYTNVKGNGVNLKLGAIFRPNDNIRVGAAFHSPSVYALTETYTPSISSAVANKTINLNTSNQGTVTDQFSYSFVTPWRGILSGSYVMKGIGFVTLDYEYVGYGSMGYIYPTSDGYGNSYAQQEYDMNQKITSTYQNTSNVRIGAEGLLSKFIMARVGFGYYGNPYKVSTVNGQRMDFNAGIGFRDKDFFIDLAFVHSIYQAQLQPYAIDYNYIKTDIEPVAAIPVAKTDFSLNNIAMTIGFKF